MNDLFGLDTLFSFALSASEIARNLAAALICGALIAVFYVAATGRFSRSRTFLNGLIALAMITAVVIMVIGNNLARAFGLVGAMSIIRFRTAVKDVQDIVFIFFSLTIGMAAGVGLMKLAVIGTLFIGAIMVALSRLQVGAVPYREYVLHLSYAPSDDPKPPYIAVLERYFAAYHLVNTQTTGAGEPIQVAYYVRLGRRKEIHEAIDALRATEGVETVNLLFDENAT